MDQLVKWQLLIFDNWNFVSRLGISYPELTEMQARAVFQAAVSISNHGITVLPEIMVPLIGTPQAWSFPFFILLCYSSNCFTCMMYHIWKKIPMLYFETLFILHSFFLNDVSLEIYNMKNYLEFWHWWNPCKYYISPNFVCRN